MNSELLAWRKHPEPNGIKYFAKDLIKKSNVIVLFDYCQILEATILDFGWKYLFENYQLKGIIEIDSKSRWMDDEDIREWINSIFYNSLISGYEPLKKEFGEYNDKNGIFTNSKNENREIDWEKIYNLKNTLTL